jgi:branched-chain amino acid aminotransferase
VQPTNKIWHDGALVDWREATVHVATHALHYGSAVFEGVRVYDTANGPAGFRLTDHLERLQASAQLIHMELPYTVDELCTACAELVEANATPECYIRPLAFYGYGRLGLNPIGNPVSVSLISWVWDSYLGPEASRGISAQISSWRRVGPNTVPHVAKATGIYLNSILARVDATRAGHDEAILLTHDGYIADGSAENIFVVKDGSVRTPPLSTSILPGLTRDAILIVAQELGLPVSEEPLIRTDLYLADEVFATGTAAGVVPVRAVDGHQVRDTTFPVATALRDAYEDLVRGRRGGHDAWVELLGPLRQAG